MIHAALAIYFLYWNKPNELYLLILIPMGLIFFDGLYTIIWKVYRKEEGDGLSKGFWTSGFLYIAAIIPIIWIVEIDLFQGRKFTANAVNNTVIDLTVAAREDSVIKDVMYKVFKTFSSNEIVGKKLCEIGLFIGLIVGRWIMPLGHLNTEEFSSLLLNFVGITPDIMELFETLAAFNKVGQIGIIYAVLVIYTVSALQFTIVTTSSLRFSRNSGRDVEGSSKKDKYIVNEDDHEQDCCCRCCEWHDEFFQIFVTLLMHEVPFFVLRLTLSINYNIISELHIFFLVKNGVTIIILLHRLLTMGCYCCHNKDSTPSPVESAEEKGYDNPAMMGLVEQYVGERQASICHSKEDNMNEPTAIEPIYNEPINEPTYHYGEQPNEEDGPVNGSKEDESELRDVIDDIIKMYEPMSDGDQPLKVKLNIDIN